MSNAMDLFLRSVEDMQRADADLQEAQEQGRAVDAFVTRWRAALDEANQNNAANIAVSYALRQQLARYAPDHPLVKNRELRAKIGELGARAYAVSRNFDDARRVGGEYFPPDKT